MLHMNVKVWLKVIYIHKKTTQVTKIILTQYGGLIKPFPNSLTNCKLFIFTKKSLILHAIRYSPIFPPDGGTRPCSSISLQCPSLLVVISSHADTFSKRDQVWLTILSKRRFFSSKVRIVHQFPAKKKNPKNWWMHTAGKWQTTCIYSNVIRFFIIQHDFAVLGWIYLILKGVCLVLVAKTGEIFHNVLHSPFRSIRVTGFLLLWRGPFFRLSLSFNSAIKTSKVHWYMTMELPVSLRTLTQFFSPVVILWRSCRVVWRW